MKSKTDVTEVRVEELTAELSRKTEEAHQLKVIQIDPGKGCLFFSLYKMYALDNGFY